MMIKGLNESYDFYKSCIRRNHWYANFYLNRKTEELKCIDNFAAGCETQFNDGVTVELFRFIQINLGEQLPIHAWDITKEYIESKCNQIIEMF